MPLSYREFMFLDIDRHECSSSDCMISRTFKWHEGVLHIMYDEHPWLLTDGGVVLDQQISCAHDLRRE